MDGTAATDIPKIPAPGLKSQKAQVCPKSKTRHPHVIVRQGVAHLMQYYSVTKVPKP